MDSVVDMLGNDIRVGDKVKVYTLIGQKNMMNGRSRVVGCGVVRSLKGIPSQPEGMVWVKGLVSCHHPKAVRLTFRKQLNKNSKDFE
jgi:hypothetical protein